MFRTWKHIQIGEAFNRSCDERIAEHFLHDLGNDVLLRDAAVYLRRNDDWIGDATNAYFAIASQVSRKGTFVVSVRPW